MAFKRHHFQPDTPTNVFATLNQLATPTNRSVVSDGNLKTTFASAHTGIMASISYPDSGKWYTELISNGWDNQPVIGIYPTITNNADVSGSEGDLALYLRAYRGSVVNQPGYSNDSPSYFLLSSGNLWSVGDVLGILVDMDNHKFIFYKNGEVCLNGNPPISLNIEDGHKYALLLKGYNGNFICNFGQDHTFGGYPNGLAESTGYADTNNIGQFYYQPPAGALALCTENLPVTPITAHLDEEPGDYFKAVTYMGNGGTQDISTGFRPDLVWIKARETGYAQLFNDSLRGTGVELRGNENGAQVARPHGFTAFNTTGFSVGANDAYNDSNPPKGMVAWCWKAGGSAGKYNVDGKAYASAAEAGFGAGTITPTGMSVNTKSGFSIIKWTGNNTSGAKIPHGLNKAPELIMTKDLDMQVHWFVYSSALNLTGYLSLNDTLAASRNSQFINGEPPDESVITTGHNPGTTNVSGHEHITYAWHSVPGYSSIGSYTGNGSTDGAFVYTGFKPAYVLIKRPTSESWIIADSALNPYNPITNFLIADGEAQESSGINYEFLSNGIKFRAASQNESDSYMYMAFAEKPQTPASRVTIPKPEIKANDMRSMYFDGKATSSGSADALRSSDTTNYSSYTFSMWFKRGMANAPSSQYMISSVGSSNRGINIGGMSRPTNQDNMLVYYNGTFDTYGISKVVDLATWYHLFLTWDGSEFKIYLNNRLEITSNVGLWADSSTPVLGAWIGGDDVGSYGYNGYMSNVHLIDGQALESSAFTETVNDVLIPKQYEGAYGTNGFHLDFAPEDMEYSGDTITRVLDESPNSNHWTAH